MSKAFTRESDDAPELPVGPRRSPLPPGAKNYLTPDGERRLRAELDRLTQVAPTHLDSVTDDVEAKGRLQAIHQRIADVRQILESAVVVPPPSAPEDRVRFGATVTVRERGGETRYRIVGVDEADFDQGSVSWLSPIAKALLNARVGQRVRFRFPSGEEELEIAGIVYE